ncbi:MAG: hypothetical protein FWF30_01760, partial [Coriobacteriia bacterium]|nr:hypothetical protein [Coriobacteriia bacterium]
MDNEELHKLEAELDGLLAARSEIDSQIAGVEKSIELIKLTKRPPSPGFSLLFEADALPDILEDQIGEQKIASRSSSIEEKYSLFASLFAGRPDVHARRFLRKDGSAGYSPVCANQFDSSFCPKNPKVEGKANCISCSHQDFSPLSIEAFEAHLKGNDDLCRDVLGAYPIDGNDLCSFIVADFDGKKKAGDDTFDNSKDAIIRGQQAAH